jgi:hypothetical protein
MRKVRTEEDSFPILVINTIDESHGFFTDAYPKSSHQFASELTESIRESAKKYHFPSRIQADTARLKWARNHMILCITTTLDVVDIVALSGLTRDNDVIVIHVFHPYEVAPSDDLLFAWLSLSNKWYKKEFDSKVSEIKKSVIKCGGSYLSMTTEILWVPCMNHFFKNRFERKS